MDGESAGQQRRGWGCRGWRKISDNENSRHLHFLKYLQSGFPFVSPLDPKEVNDPFSFLKNSEDRVKREAPSGQQHTAQPLLQCLLSPTCKVSLRCRPHHADLQGLTGQHQSCPRHPAGHGRPQTVLRGLWECHYILRDQTQGCFCRNAQPGEALMSFSPREAALLRKGGDRSWRQEISLRQTQSHPRLTAKHVRVITAPLRRGDTGG